MEVIRGQEGDCVPKYVVKLSAEERDRLEAMVRAGKNSAQILTAPEARSLVERFEWHYTPKHGSWLDMAESELAVLTRQCLSRRIPDKPTLKKEVAAWERHRSKHHAKADWLCLKIVPADTTATGQHGPAA